jgi:PleD family two-component response regulator
VRSSVAETLLDQDEGCITVSIGVAQCLSADDAASSLISQADQALLRAKAVGRNHIIASQSG